MAVPGYFGWGLLIPAAFSLLYGFTAYYAMDSLGYLQKNTVLERLRLSLPVLFLFVCWGMVNIPLTAVYILAFLGKLLRLSKNREKGQKQLFLINLTHLMTVSFHMILVGVLSIIIAEPPYELLQHPFWRIATIGTVLAVDNLAACLLPRWAIPFKVLHTQMNSEEVRPFMAFLWFCNIFLLLDSVLCISEIDWELLPLFLISSTVLMEYYLIRFLHHLYAILKVQYLEKEHQRLKAELEMEYETAKYLRSRSERDALTGIYSRRYAMDQLELLLKKGETFTLVYIDLDRLKQFNDREGHRAGDLYLVKFAGALGSALQERDVFARIGGDEFIILFPGCALEDTVRCMEENRIRMGRDFRPPLSFSFGAAFVPADSNETPQQVLDRADRAMYQDKNAKLRGGESLC